MRYCAREETVSGMGTTRYGSDRTLRITIETLRMIQVKGDQKILKEIIMLKVKNVKLQVIIFAWSG